MAKVVIVQNNTGFEAQYRMSDRYLDDKYHRYPTNINMNPVSKADQAAQAAMAATANQIVANATIPSGTPIGKTVL